MAWNFAGQTITCEGCSIVTPKRSGNHQYCAKCYKSRHRKSRGASANKGRQATRGRVCRECDATDEEKNWSQNRDLCSGCARAFLRAKASSHGGIQCKKCKRLGGSLGCVYCTKATPGLVDVILISEKTEQQRVVRRAIRKDTPEGLVQVIVGFRGQKPLVDPNDPVLWVDHQVYLSARR